MAEVASQVPVTKAPEVVDDGLTPKQRKEAELRVAWDTLHQYWQFVQDNPYDFDGWTYLLSHVENMVSDHLFQNVCFFSYILLGINKRISVNQSSYDLNILGWFFFIK